MNIMLLISVCSLYIQPHNSRKTTKNKIPIRLLKIEELSERKIAAVMGHSVSQETGKYITPISPTQPHVPRLYPSSVTPS